MLNIGCHLSASKGYLAMGKECVKTEGSVFQFFTRNPRGAKSKALDLDDIKKYEEFAKENGLGMLLAHAPYTMNPCSADEGIRELAKTMMLDDLEKLEHLSQVQYNFHPGSHVKQGVDIGIDFISDMLNEVLKVEGKTPILLEAMAGKGTEIGRNFTELHTIIEKTGNHPRMGVCLDTCHVHDGGYDIVNNLDGVLEEFDQIIGLDRLKAIHLNDSKNICDSHKDRHEQIGKGEIGLDAIKSIINHPKLRHLPFYLETPHEDLNGYKDEIALLKSLFE